MAQPGEVDLRALLPRVAQRVWTLRCPRCGSKGVFQRYAKLHEACPTCDHRFRREQGAQTGSMYLTAAVNQVFAAIVILVVFTSTDWSTTRQIAVSLSVVLVVCAVFLPFSQTLWAGFEYVTDRINAEPWVEGDDERVS